MTLALVHAQRLISAGMTTINPKDKAAIEALFSNPTLIGTAVRSAKVFVGSELPVDATPPYVWFQTGLAHLY